MSFATEIRIGQKKKLTEVEKKAANKLRLEEREKDSQMVKGVFKNIEAPNGDATITYHKYKEDPTTVYHFWDGDEREIPLGCAKQINQMCRYKKSKHLVDKNGKYRDINLFLLILCKN